jgi:hypothetical protein
MDDKINAVYLEIFNKFRGSIDDIFSEQERQWNAKSNVKDFTPSMNKFSFKELINQSKAALGRSSKDNERYDVAAGLIQDVSAFTKVDHLIGVMFHETVVTGANVLMGIYKYLTEFRAAVAACNPGKGGTDFKSMKADMLAGSPTISSAGATLTIVNKKVAAAELKVLELSDSDSDTAILAAIEHTANHSLLYRSFIEKLMQHSGDLQGMIEIKFSDRNLYIDYSVLIKEVTSLFETTKFYFNKFRGFIPDELRKDYEDLKTPGSIPFLEENLMEEVIRGSRLLGVDRQNIGILKLNNDVSETFKLLTGQYMYYKDLAMFPNLTKIPKDNKLVDDKTYPDHSAYYKSVTYFNLAVGVTPAGIVYKTNTKAAAMLETRNTKNKQAYFRHLAGFSFAYDVSTEPSFACADPTAQGALVQFNNMLFHLLSVCFDPTSRHIYAPIINNLVNSSLNSNIMGNHVIPDLRSLMEGVNNCADNARDGDANIAALGVPVMYDISTIVPNVDTILFASLSAIIQNLQSGFANNTSTKIATESLTDIPMFVRETMKANLPIFEKLFDLLRMRCNILRLTLEKGAKVMLLAGYAPAAPIGGVTFVPVGTKDGEYRNRLDGILKSIVEGCQTVIKIIKQTTSDMNDVPKFMETSQEFIADYEAANHKKPLALISSILSPLVNMDPFVGMTKELNNEFMPVAIYGTTSFKFLYGTRAVLKSSVPADVSMVDRFNELVTLYNSMTNPIYAVDVGRMADYTLPLIKLTRFLVDANQYKRLFTGVNYYLYLTADTGDLSLLKQKNVIEVKFAVFENKPGAVPYQLNNLKELIDLTESKYQDDRLRTLSHNILNDQSIDSSRDKIMIYNILDMNIVPINVHAMQRELPLANLYNYSWTFDKMICSLLNINSDILSGADFRESEARFMTKMVVSPYGTIHRNDYDSYMNNIFRGYTDTEMGRPKYLSDQIFNKVLFGEVYRGPYEWNKRGPQANGRYKSMLSYNEIYMYIFAYWLKASTGKDYTEIIRLEGTKHLENLLTAHYREMAVDLASYIYLKNQKQPANDYTNWVSTDDMNFKQLVIKHTWSPDEIESLKILFKYMLEQPHKEDSNYRYEQMEVYNNNNFHLSFLKSPAPKAQPNAFNDVVVIPLISVDYRIALNKLGYERFNTNFIRSLTFLGQIHRLINYKISKDLTAHSDVVIRGNSMVDPNVVDYARNRAFNATSHMSTTPHSSYVADDTRR